MEIDDLICPGGGHDEGGSESSNLSVNLSFGPPVSRSSKSPPGNPSIFASILAEFFANRSPAPAMWLRLSTTQRDLLSEALRRKFQISELGVAKLRKSRRRSEEECKFVVKKGMKSLFKAFKRRHQGFILGSKSLDEAEFYRHYFAEQALLSEQPIDLFFLPGSKAQKDSSLLPSLDKTVSSVYLHRIFASEKFRDDFLRYLYEDFYRESLKTRESKLEKLVGLLVAGKRCKSAKIPWTDQEIQVAQSHLVGIITSFS